MRPEFGCAIHDLVFDTIDADTIGRIDTAIRVALDRWEPRIEVLAVDFDLSERRRGRAAIDIRYRIRATNDVHNLVYPFYLIPAEESRVSLPADPARRPAASRTWSTRRDCGSPAACPEWTEHNVSDPGITLIELFAWMTDMLIYRLNRVPDKLHVALLELLGIELARRRPPAAHRGSLPALGGAGRAAVRDPGRTPRSGRSAPPRDESIVFQVAERLHDPAAEADGLRGRARRRSRRRSRSLTAPPGRRDRDQAAVRHAPQVGDALYLGFDEDLAHLLVRRRHRRLAGARRRRRSRGPAAALGGQSTGGAMGGEAEVLADHTGGFNYGPASVELQCPPAPGIAPVGGHAAALAPLPARPSRHAPGARRGLHPSAGDLLDHRRVRSAHWSRSSTPRWRPRSASATSDGTPGQHLRAALRAGARHRPRRETLEVREPGSETGGCSGRWWSRSPESGPDDRALQARRQRRRARARARRSDSLTAAGRQYGAIPPKGAELRMSALPPRRRPARERRGRHADARCAARSPAWRR